MEGSQISTLEAQGGGLAPGAPPVDAWQQAWRSISPQWSQMRSAVKVRFGCICNSIASLAFNNRNRCRSLNEVMYPFGNTDFCLCIHITTVVQQEAHQIAGRISLLLKINSLGEELWNVEVYCNELDSWLGCRLTIRLCRIWKRKYVQQL